VLFVVEAFAAALGGLLRPSLDSLTPRLVDKDELTAAGALDSLRFQVGLIGGPAIGGVSSPPSGCRACSESTSRRSSSRRR
jgi:hypothetical protein